MRTTIFAKTAIALAIVMLVPLLAQPAAANQPLISRFQINQDFIVPAGAFCAFPVQFVEEIGIVEKFFLDSLGNEVRAAVFVTLDATITNLSNGNSLTERNRFTVFFDIPFEGDTFVGLPFRIKVPRGGTVTFDAGRLEFDPDGNIIFVAGPHPVAESGFDFAGVVCPALE